MNVQELEQPASRKLNSLCSALSELQYKLNSGKSSPQFSQKSGEICPRTRTISLLSSAVVIRRALRRCRSMKSAADSLSMVSKGALYEVVYSQMEFAVSVVSCDRVQRLCLGAARSVNHPRHNHRSFGGRGWGRHRNRYEPGDQSLEEADHPSQRKLLFRTDTTGRL